MDKAMRPDTPESWGAASRGYAEKVAPILMAAFTEELVDLLEVSAEHEVLEVAAGSGALTRVLAPRAGSVLATDFSPQMLEVLGEQLDAAGIDNVKLELMDGQALDVDDASFDRAACCFGLMLFPDRARGFSELRRALRPKGRAMVAGWGGPDRFEAFAIFTGALKTAYPDLPPPPAPPPVFSLANLEQFKAEMEAAGFAGVETRYVTRELEVDSFETMWGMLTVGAPPVKMLFERLGEGGEERVRDTLAEIVEQRFGSGPINLTNSATVGTGTAP